MGGSTLTSEKRFALSHAAFWNALLPMEESYVRAHNTRLRRFAPIVLAETPASQRGLVNELGFLLFASSLELRIHPEGVPREVVDHLADEALNYVARMLQVHRVPASPISASGIHEARALASNLASYFAAKPWRALRAKPFFPGCGWVDDAEGDLLGDTTLFEIKAGERQFRGTDVRQLLCYCALSLSARAYDIDTVCLMNPRFGTCFQDHLETLCQKIAGLSAADVLGEIVNYMAEPFSRYTTG
jgi:hypothetical protein